MPQEPQKRPSQTEIAREVGCSQALVSMALNGRTKGIAPQTYQRIREIAFRHGYTPRGMRLDETTESLAAPTVGYLLRTPLKLANKSNFFSHVHQGLHELLSERRIKTLYLGSEDDLSNSAAPLLSHVSDSVKAIAIMGQVQEGFFRQLKNLKLPLIYISARAEGECHSVLSNEKESGERLVEHLSSLGHKRFAWLGGNRSAMRHDDRLQSVQAALQRRGATLEPRFTITTEAADRADGYEAARQILAAAKSARSLPTAWLSFNALMARGAINHLFQQGIHVPDAVSVAAFDMTRVCEEESPGITSAGADPESMGRAAGRLILDALQQETSVLSDLTLPAKFVERETTGKASTPPSKSLKTA